MPAKVDKGAKLADWLPRVRFGKAVFTCQWPILGSATVVIVEMRE